jgi:AbrB family looped-hinge helix DNA binding protein
MHTVTCTITGKGQVTLPKSIRTQLGVDISDKVSFVILDSGRVEIRPVRYTLKDLNGIVAGIPGRESEDFDELFDEAMEERIDQLAGLTSE